MDQRLRKLKRQAETNPDLLPQYIAALEQAVGGVNTRSIASRYAMESILTISTDDFVNLVKMFNIQIEFPDSADYSEYCDTLKNLLQYGANITAEQRDTYLTNAIFILKDDSINSALDRLLHGWGAGITIETMEIHIEDVRKLLEHAREEGFDYLMIEDEN